MPASKTLSLAETLRLGDQAAQHRVCRGLLRMSPNNLVERPWGGRRLISFKSLDIPGPGFFGESFEVAADPQDKEAAEHPSGVILEDHSSLLLAEILEIAADDVLGIPFTRDHGKRIPILPKILDVQGLLSVQAHPPGMPEAYFVLEADAGCDLRVGFSKSVDRRAAAARFQAGRLVQSELRSQIGALDSTGCLGDENLHCILAPLFTRRESTRQELMQALVERLPGIRGQDQIQALVAELHATYWYGLDLMNRIPIAVGDVVFNATPGPRTENLTLSAQMHALGNPEGRSALILEIRCPGSTLRAWDHVRFPLRDVDPEGAFEAVGGEESRAEDFRIRPIPLKDHPGVFISAKCSSFVTLHLRPRPGLEVVSVVGTDIFTPPIPLTYGPRTFHVIQGTVEVLGPDGLSHGVYGRGHSAVVSAHMNHMRFVAVGGAAEVIEVRIPRPTGTGSRIPGASASGGCDAPPISTVSRESAPVSPTSEEHEATTSSVDSLGRTDGRFINLSDLRGLVDGSRGPLNVLAIVNGGDAEFVCRELDRQKSQLFRADGQTSIFAHEEISRRGQFLGLLDAHRHHEAHHGTLDQDRVALGIMLPGKGTRFSPITQRLHGIKSFLPVPVRHTPGGEWLTAAAASLYSWTLVSHHLERMGFRGIAWKWGDEPQIASNVLAQMDLDLSRTDAVRFGSAVVIDEDLAANKEWLHRDETTSHLIRQLRRRPLSDLLKAMDKSRDPHPRAVIHTGSPAFSHLFIETATRIFSDEPGFIDVDGYLFEALTHTRTEWSTFVHSDADLRTWLVDHPDFYEQVQELRFGIESVRGHPLEIKVIDLGANMYWGDIGQLDRARKVFSNLGNVDNEGAFARALACLDGLEPDEQGNRIGENSRVSGVEITSSLIVESRIEGPGRIEGAVILSSTIGRAHLGPGSVVLGSTVLNLEAGARALSFRSVSERLAIAPDHVHTSIPSTPHEPKSPLEDWRADARINPGHGEAWSEPTFSNPDSFARKFEQMRQRQVPPEDVESSIDNNHASVLRSRLGHERVPD